MEFKITIILSHIENQSVEDMELNAQNYIKEFIEDDELYIESIEDITSTRKTILEQQELNRKIAKTEGKPSDNIIKYVVADILEIYEDMKLSRDYYKEESEKWKNEYKICETKLKRLDSKVKELSWDFTQRYMGDDVD